MSDTSDSETEQEAAQIANLREAQRQDVHTKMQQRLADDVEPEKYVDINAFTDNEFPNDWTDEDMAFLAQFLREELNVHLVHLLGEHDFGYLLFVEEDCLE